MKIAILGNGPAAAYAYRACIDQGITPTVYAAGKPAHPGGAFWLHWLPSSIPETLTAPHAITAQMLGIGTEEMYSGKMWGETHRTSFPAQARLETGFRPEALELLWDGFSDWVNSGILRDPGVEQLAKEYDLVLQTFPTDQAKMAQAAATVHFTILSRPLLGPDSKLVLCLYNGTADLWVRMTVGLGAVHIEFPPETPIHPALWPSHIWLARRYPDMHPKTLPMTRGAAPNVVLLGRHARWDRKLLSHSAYEGAVRAIQNKETES